MADERGRSLVGHLVDMPVGEFRELVASANMTTLLNLTQVLDIAYRHTVGVKDALLDALETDSRDSWAAADTVRKLHTVLLDIERRFVLVKETIGQRDSDTDKAYRDYL